MLILRLFSVTIGEFISSLQKNKKKYSGYCIAEKNYFRDSHPANAFYYDYTPRIGPLILGKIFKMFFGSLFFILPVSKRCRHRLNMGWTIVHPADKIIM